MFEIKSIPFELKDIDTTSRRVVKYVSAFGNEDTHRDIVQKGAYAKTIRENKSRIKFLWNHDSTGMPVGVLDEIEEDEFVLKVTSKILPTTKGNDLLICYENGAVNEHSVGFYTINKKSNDKGNRIITEAHLLEYSAVLWGSNENTPLLGMKSSLAPIDQLAELQKRSQRLYKSISVGNLSDETCQLLALEHTLINKAMTDLIESLSTSEPETLSTPEAPEPMKVTEKSIDVAAAFLAAYKSQK